MESRESYESKPGDACRTGQETKQCVNLIPKLEREHDTTSKELKMKERGQKNRLLAKSELTARATGGRPHDSESEDTVPGQHQDSVHIVIVEQL